MNLRIFAMAGLMMVGLVAFDGTASDTIEITQPAEAVCTYNPVTGEECDNPCMDLGRAVYKLTKQDPWDCPM